MIVNVRDCSSDLKDWVFSWRPLGTYKWLKSKEFDQKTFSWINSHANRMRSRGFYVTFKEIN